MQIIGSGQTILQVVQTSYATTVAISSSSYQTTGNSASITPLYSTSKILVISNTPVYMGTNNATYCNIALFRNGSTNLASVYNGISINNNDSQVFPGTIIYLDSPATTSSTTYTAYGKVTYDASTYVYPQFQYLSQVSTMTLLEVSGA
jgi:hypothetical protein